MITESPRQKPDRREIDTAATVPLARLLPLIRPYWKSQALTLLCLVGATGFGLLVPLLIRHLIDVALPDGNQRLLVGLLSGMLAIHLISAAFSLATDILFTRVSGRILLDLRSMMYEKLLALPITRLDGARSGGVMARLLGDVDALQALTTDALLVMVTSCFSIVFILALLFTLSVPLTLAGVASVVLLAGVFRVFDSRLRSAALLSRESYGKISEHAHETIAGMREVRAFGCEASMAHAYGRVLRRHFRAAIRLGVTSSLARIATLLVASAGPLLVYGFGGLEVIKGTLTLGSLVAFVAYLDQLFGPVQTLSYLNFRVQAARAAMQRVFGFLDLAPAPAGGDKTAPGNQHAAGIEIEGVTFCYDGGRGPTVLTEVSFSVRPGEKVAIVGPSGAGKSTLAGLICRFYQPCRGKIRINGVDLMDLAQAELKRLVALVPQDTFLFHSSVLANLRVARPGASRDEVLEAIRQAGAAEFVATLPRGLDTMVGERGIRISGGQRQRLAIARAILRDPAVVILDEATSSLDPETERLVKTSMAELTGGRTTLVISHRLATVVDADRIVVLDRGRIVDQGTYSELAKRSAQFRKLFDEQPGASAAVGAGSRTEGETFVPRELV